MLRTEKYNHQSSFIEAQEHIPFEKQFYFQMKLEQQNILFTTNKEKWWFGKAAKHGKHYSIWKDNSMKSKVDNCRKYAKHTISTKGRKYMKEMRKEESWERCDKEIFRICLKRLRHKSHLNSIELIYRHKKSQVMRIIFIIVLYQDKKHVILKKDREKNRNYRTERYAYSLKVPGKKWKGSPSTRTLIRKNRRYRRNMT